VTDDVAQLDDYRERRALRAAAGYAVALLSIGWALDWLAARYGNEQKGET
jgi:hypothetical protein